MTTRKSDETLTRRDLLAAGAGLVGTALAVQGKARAAGAGTTAQAGSARSESKLGYRPVTVPNGAKLPWKMINGTKVFHMIAEEVDHEFAPGFRARCWGYNGSVHGPLIEAVEGDHVRIYVSNRLPAATSVHWHGFILPNGMDGVAGLNQKAIAPGETYRYEFTIRQHGTFMYHSHHDEMTQMALGMTGMFVVHPRSPRSVVDRDFAILLHEWRIDPGAERPDPNEMIEFNTLTMNAKVFPATAPLVVKTGQRVRIRLANLSAMDHHPIHIHGLNFKITETDGGMIPASAQWPETTVLVAAGQTRTIEFIPTVPGDWAAHCHMTHHVMNQMGHGLPNMVGVKAGTRDPNIQKLLPGYMSMGETGMAEMGEMGMAVPKNSIPMVGARGKHDYITMGGMFTVLKVRNQLASYEDPGWYENPAGTSATTATTAELERDGIRFDAPVHKEETAPHKH